MVLEAHHAYVEFSGTTAVNIVWLVPARTKIALSLESMGEIEREGRRVTPCLKWRRADIVLGVAQPCFLACELPQWLGLSLIPRSGLAFWAFEGPSIQFQDCFSLCLCFQHEPERSLNIQSKRNTLEHGL